MPPTDLLERVSVIDHAIDRIENSPVLTDPFPHIIIDQLLPDDCFADLVANFPPRHAFSKVVYPGTGYGRHRSKKADYGLACNDLREHGPFTAVDRLFRSDRLARALLRKFSKPVDGGPAPIPLVKHKHFADGACDFTTVFKLHIDLPGYELPPHRDVQSKIVTFQYYLVADEALKDFGTLLYRLTPGRTTAGRSRVARFMGRSARSIARGMRVEDSGFNQWLARSRFALWSGMANQHFLPWSHFEPVKCAPCLPNHFMAFAPNESSFHGVRLDVPPQLADRERRVLRGFILEGAESKNWIRDPSEGQFRS